MDALREKNLDTIRKFLACAGPERKDTRRPLFTADAVKEMELALPTGTVLQHDSAFDWLEDSSAGCPQWGFYENQIFQTEDPNYFLVKSVGRGNQDFEHKGFWSCYINYYVNEFWMEDGKIKLFRETVNPFARLHL